MCGGCRVLVDGKSEFACVDGPEFDAHRVDFSVLIKRYSMYREQEQKSLAVFECAAEAQVKNVRAALRAIEAVAK